MAWSVTTPGACGIPGLWLVPVMWPPFLVVVAAVVGIKRSMFWENNEMATRVYEFYIWRTVQKPL